MVADNQTTSSRTERRLIKQGCWHAGRRGRCTIYRELFIKDDGGIMRQQCHLRSRGREEEKRRQQKARVGSGGSRDMRLADGGAASHTSHNFVIYIVGGRQWCLPRIHGNERPGARNGQDPLSEECLAKRRVDVWACGCVSVCALLCATTSTTAVVLMAV